jgi:hypothetical protein
MPKTSQQNRNDNKSFNVALVLAIITYIVISVNVDFGVFGYILLLILVIPFGTVVFMILLSMFLDS